MLPAHRVFAGNDFAVIVTKRLRGPEKSFWILGQIHIDEFQFRMIQKYLERLRGPRYDFLEPRFVFCNRRAERDPAQAQQRALLGSRDSAGMPYRVAEVAPELDAR